MTAQNAIEPKKSHAPRHGRAAPRAGDNVPLVTDRDTINALPTSIHKRIIEMLIDEGTVVVKDVEETGAIR